MLRDDMFSLLNSMLKSAIEKDEDIENVQGKINKYVEFISTNKIADTADIEAFKIVSSNLPELLSFYSALLEKGVGIKILPDKNPKKRIGFK